MTLHLVTLLTFFLLSQGFKDKLGKDKCVPLKGIGYGPNEAPPGETIDKVAAFFFAPISALPTAAREPAITFRLVSLGALESYNAIEPYFEGFMEAFGRRTVDRRRQRCVEGVPFSELQQYIDMSVTYSFYYTWSYYAEETPLFNQQDVDDVIAGFGYDPHICENLGCDDEDTPWGLAYQSHLEIIKFYESDGYNRDGSYNRQYNRVPYEDWRDNPYTPKNNPWNLKFKKKWQPLQENDGLGFLYNQEHVVPHIGFTARYFYTPTKEICKTRVTCPEYDYDTEIDLLLDRLAQLTDYQKGEIELFDDKTISLAPLTFQFDILRGNFPYSADGWLNLWLSSQAIQEATQLVWRHKVKNDRVRPPSIIHKLRENDLITTYAGQDENGFGLGTQTFLGKDFQSYIRTMPHSEYPSGSACVCEASTQYFRNITGDDYILEYTNGVPLTLEWAANSSKIERGVPAQDITYVYTSWSQISQTCAQSRLNGGMHFTDSITGGADLCRSMGTRFADVYRKLSNGQKPDYVVSIKDTKLRQDICSLK